MPYKDILSYHDRRALLLARIVSCYLYGRIQVYLDVNTITVYLVVYITGTKLRLESITTQRHSHQMPETIINFKTEKKDVFVMYFMLWSIT